MKKRINNHNAEITFLPEPEEPLTAFMRMFSNISHKDIAIALLFNKPLLNETNLYHNSQITKHLSHLNTISHIADKEKIIAIMPHYIIN